MDIVFKIGERVLCKNTNIMGTVLALPSNYPENFTAVKWDGVPNGDDCTPTAALELAPKAPTIDECIAVVTSMCGGIGHSFNPYGDEIVCLLRELQECRVAFSYRNYLISYRKNIQEKL